MKKIHIKAESGYEEETDLFKPLSPINLKNYPWIHHLSKKIPLFLFFVTKTSFSTFFIPERDVSDTHSLQIEEFTQVNT